MSSISLVGLPGSGKTALGRLLAERLGLPFFDLDEEIERHAGRSIAQLFAESERVFRDIESLVTQAFAGRDAVLSTGGGAIEREENVAALKRGGRVIFLDRPVEHIFRDVDAETRPLLKDDRTRLLALDRRRRALYIAAADAVVVNDGAMEETLRALVEASQTEEGCIKI